MLITFNKKGQGTIEYLVIIAVVLVLALVAVYVIFSSMGSASAVDKASLKAAWQSKEVGIADFALDSDGSGKIALMNNSGELIRIKQVYIDGKLVFNGPLFSIGNFDKFVLGNFAEFVTACNSERRYNIRIIYEGESGLEHEVSGDLYPECMGGTSTLTSGTLFLTEADAIDFNIQKWNIDLNGTTGLFFLFNSQAINTRNIDDISKGSSPDLNVKYDNNIVTLNIR